MTQANSTTLTHTAQFAAIFYGWIIDDGAGACTNPSVSKQLLDKPELGAVLLDLEPRKGTRPYNSGVVTLRGRLLNRSDILVTVPLFQIAIYF